MMNDGYWHLVNSNELIRHSKQVGRPPPPPLHKTYSSSCSSCPRPPLRLPPPRWTAPRYLVPPWEPEGPVSSVRRLWAHRPSRRCTWSRPTRLLASPWSRGSPPASAPPARCPESWRSSRWHSLKNIVNIWFEIWDLAICTRDVTWHPEHRR